MFVLRVQTNMKYCTGIHTGLMVLDVNWNKEIHSRLQDSKAIFLRISKAIISIEIASSL